MSIGKKTIYSIAWVTLSTVLIRILGFGTQIVLARILTPADFGLIAIGLLIINAMGIFRDLGFGAALIYKKEDENNTAANSAFIVLPLFALFLVSIAYVSAPHIALFFDNEMVEPMVRILSLTFVVSSIGTVPSMLLEKELEFKKKFIPETIPTIGYACFTILLAIKGYGIWSLIYGQIVSALLTAGSIWAVSDWRPTFNFDLKVTKELFNYGKHVISSSIMLFMITNVDNAIVGKILGSEALGFYAMAFIISNLPATQISHLIGRVMFPAYSKLQDSRNTLRYAYLNTLNSVSILSIPISFGIMVIAPDFVNVFLGNKWAPAIPSLQILCIFGLLRSISATFTPIFNATGNPKIIRNLSFLQLIMLLILIFPLTNRYGIVGTALATTIPMFFSFILQFIKIADILNQELTFIAKKILIIVVNSIIMMLTVYFTKQFVPIYSILSLFLSILVGVAVYTFLTAYTSKETVVELKTIINEAKFIGKQD